MTRREAEYLEFGRRFAGYRGLQNEAGERVSPGFPALDAFYVLAVFGRGRIPLPIVLESSSMAAAIYPSDAEQAASFWHARADCLEYLLHQSPSTPD